MTLELRTERLLLRRWRAGDRPDFASLNADPAVMEHFPGVIDRAESDAVADRIDAHFVRHGFGCWAVEVPKEIPFVGFVGLSVPSISAPFMPAVEVGWRLAKAWWDAGSRPKRRGRRSPTDSSASGLKRSSHSPRRPTFARRASWIASE